MRKRFTGHFGLFKLADFVAILLMPLVFAYPSWAGAKKCDLTKAGPKSYEEILNRHPVWEN